MEITLIITIIICAVITWIVFYYVTKKAVASAIKSSRQEGKEYDHLLRSILVQLSSQSSALKYHVIDKEIEAEFEKKVSELDQSRIPYPPDLYLKKLRELEQNLIEKEYELKGKIAEEL